MWCGATRFSVCKLKIISKSHDLRIYVAEKIRKTFVDRQTTIFMHYFSNHGTKLDCTLGLGT